ncbi:MAG TPA: Npt1/Npt2 family nucleotide transporter [Candidatus Udaeobacter sp.]|nr:Npt1/Npt2 family nucleotide transporter [Candidatus Udaeobacter sp.]
MNRILAKIVDAKPDEIRALLLAFVFNFVVLGGYYVIRPIRDEIGADRGVENLPWMYTGTLIGMLIANALYAAIVARMSRRQFIPVAYRFAIANLFVFFLLMRWMPAAQERAILAPIFFIWVSVFNLFATTMFWSFMADVFTPEQGKRLFGFIAVGGSIGGIAGGFVTSSLAGKLSTGLFLLITAVMLEIAAQCVSRFPADFRAHDKQSEEPIGGKFWEGATHIARSPYLLGLAAFLIIYTITNTWAYFQQSDLTGHQLHDRAARTSFLANIDIAVNTITVLIQIFLTGRLMKWFGVGITLVLMPLLSGVGFAAIGFAPILTVLATFQILRRATGFALLRPAREVLFTVLRREDKYKAKSLIDTFGYRLGDITGAWSYPLMQWLGFGLVGISWVAVPFAAVWCTLSIWLGRKQRQLADAKRDQSVGVPAAA